MKSFLYLITFAILTSAALAAHPDHSQATQNLPEEPSKLYVPSDYTDVFAIQLDNDALEDEEQLDTLEEMQKEEQAPKK